MAREPSLGSLTEDALVSYGSMEGWSEPAVQAAPAPLDKKLTSPWPGYALAALVAAAAYGLHYLPFFPFRIASQFGVRRPLSAAILAMLAGIAVRNGFPIPGLIVDGLEGMGEKLSPLM